MGNGQSTSVSGVSATTPQSVPIETVSQTRVVDSSLPGLSLIAPVAKARPPKKVESSEQRKEAVVSGSVVKGVLGTTSLVTLLFGIRSAWKHTKQPEAADLAKLQLASGAAFAGKALGLATLITLSGFSLLVVGVSWAVGVNTPKEFGRAMKEAFGDSLRLPQSQKSQSFEEIIRSIEEQQLAKRIAEKQQELRELTQ